jgi:hypothetical protein
MCVCVCVCVDYFATVLWSFGIINTWVVVIETLLNN